MWKLNTSLLANKEFLQKLNDKVDEAISSALELNDIDKWELLKTKIRNCCIIESRKIAKLKSQELDELLQKANDLNNSIVLNNANDDLKQQLNQVNDQINSIMQKKAEGARLRCKTQWYAEGQRSSKYFFALEKANAIKKQMRSLQLEDGSVITSQEKILNEQVCFYSRLYTSSGEVSFQLQDFQMRNVLTENQKIQLEAALTLDELSVAIQTMPNNKTPGCDGLLVEIYKVLWPKISQLYYEAITASMHQNELMQSSRKGVITLMPKKGKNTLILKNWRALTMLNVDYKIVAKALANRLKMVLPDIIDKDQTGFMKGRNIATNIRKYMEIIEYCDTLQFPAMAMSVDFEKCFDMLEHDAIFNIMKLFNFGDNFINMIRTLFLNFDSCIQCNGHVSNFFPITRSTFQGSPISSFLFLLCGQFFHDMIKQNDKIKGVSVGEYDCLISQFADDTDLFLQFDQETLDEVIKTFSILQNNVGLKVNYDKMTIYRLGSIANTNAKLYTRKPFNWTNALPNVLGVNVSQCSDQVNINNNYAIIIQKVKDILYQWQNRQLSLTGKVLIINTLVASLFVYKMSVLPNMSYNLIIQFEQLIREYLGKGNIARITLNQLKLPRDLGGLRLVDLFKRQNALKIQWAMVIQQDPFWEYVASLYLGQDNIELVWSCNLNTEDIDDVIQTSSFWKQVLYAWCLYNFNEPTTVEQIQGQILWNNSFIKINQKVVCNMGAWRGGLKYVSDLLSDQGLFLTHDQLRIKYGEVLTWYQHVQIISAIPHTWKEQIIRCAHLDPDITDNIQKICLLAKVSATVYTRLIQDQTLLESKRLIWERRLTCQITQKEFLKLFKNLVKPTVNTKLRDFQYRLLHNVVVTNHNLNVWGMKENDSCTFCNNSKEHTLHLFWQCHKVQALWKLVQDYVQLNTRSQLESILIWNEQNVMFNLVHPKPGHIINLIVLIVKQFIYKTRCLDARLSFQALENEIELTKKIEYNIAKQKGKLVYFYEKWSQLYSEMQMSDTERQNQNLYITNYLDRM